MTASPLLPWKTASAEGTSDPVSTMHTLAAVNASPAITHVRRSLWRRWHNPRAVSMSVFLIGCGRSGTNMVTRRLARSWQVDFYNEDHPAAFENYLLRD